MDVKPGWHSAHEVEFVLFATVPGLQKVHSAASAWLKAPGWHDLRSPFLQKKPASHGLQRGGLAFMSAYSCAAHGSARPPMHMRPGMQGLQSVAPPHEYFPSGHCASAPATHLYPVGQRTHCMGCAFPIESTTRNEPV